MALPTSMLKMTKSSNLAPRELETNEVIGGGSKTNDKNESV